MKYEMIFGDPQLFNDAPDDAVLVSVQLGDFSYFTEENLQVCKKFNIYKLQSCDTQLAMRRIIPKPKSWTVEDQKAGRLPDVGAKVDGGKVVFVNGFNVVTELKRGAVIVSSPKTFLNTFKPIETPEEKAARLRNEWCNEAGGVCSLGMTTLTRIYDALLSGDLPAPGKE